MTAQDRPGVAVVTGAGGGLGGIIATEFLRAGDRLAFTDLRADAAVAAAAAAHAGRPLADAVEVFAALREWKNDFR